MAVVKSQHIVTPDDDAVLWRYMDFPQFMNLLYTETLHFHRASDFGDDFEGSVPQPIRKRREQEYERAIETGDLPNNAGEIHTNILKTLRDFTFLNCWHQRNTESAAMWSKYGKGNKAIAVRTTVGKMKRALDRAVNHKIFIGSVNYEIYKPDDHLTESELDMSDEEVDRFFLTKSPHSLTPFLYKRKSFEYESEVRAIIQCLPTRTKSPTDEHEVMINKNSRKISVPESSGDTKTFLNLSQPPAKSGMDMSIFLNELIGVVRVGPEAPPWFTETVRTAVSNSGSLDQGLVEESIMNSTPEF